MSVVNWVEVFLVAVAGGVVGSFLALLATGRRRGGHRG